MAWYHVLANIDGPPNPAFPVQPTKDYAGAMALVERLKREPLPLAVPFSAAADEDRMTPRVAVAPSVEKAITGIGLLGRFRRCLAANPDARSYEAHGREVYPIIVMQYPDGTPTMNPGKELVPDSYLTGERWIVDSQLPLFVDLFWLTPRSILWRPTRSGTSPYAAASVKLLHTCQLPEDSVHPWLTGTGSILDSNMAEPPDIELVPEKLRGEAGERLRGAIRDKYAAARHQFHSDRSCWDWVFSDLDLTISEAYWLYAGRPDIPYYGSAVPGFPGMYGRL